VNFGWVYLGDRVKPPFGTQKRFRCDIDSELAGDRRNHLAYIRWLLKEDSLIGRRTSAKRTIAQPQSPTSKTSPSLIVPDIHKDKSPTVVKPVLENAAHYISTLFNPLVPATPSER
jgi:hypothetical protein